MKSQRKMKDSEVEWIGEIPEGWQLIRMKHCFSRRDSGSWGEEAKGTDGDCICLRVADMEYDKLRFSDKNTFTIRNYDSEIIQTLTLHKGDILIEKSGGGDKTPVGRAVIFDGLYQALFANFMERLRCSNNVNPHFILYILANLYQNGYIVNYIKQTTGIQNLDITTMLEKERIVLPKISVQNRIASYLDEKCAKLDAVIEKQRASIEELKAYKLAVITEAVTKGLNPDVEMKDSGVEWIGEIPNTWSTTKIKFVATLYNGDRTSKYPSGTDIVDEGVLFVTSHNLGNIVLDTQSCTSKFITDAKYDELGGAKLQLNDIVFCLRGSVGKCSINKSHDKGTIASSLVVIRANRINPDYLNYVLRCPGLTTEATLNAIGIGSLNLSAYDIAESTIVLPPPEQQNEIVNWLDSKCSLIDSTINKKEREFEKLTAYKKSLIYEVVTGKKEVA